MTTKLLFNKVLECSLGVVTVLDVNLFGYVVEINLEATRVSNIGKKVCIVRDLHLRYHSSLGKLR